MDAIRPFSTEAEFRAYVAIVDGAYPNFGLSTDEARDRLVQRMLRANRDDPTISFHGLFRDGRMIGGMRLHDFTMNLLGTQAKVGGVGALAVDLIHRKERIARDMVLYYLRHFREQGAALAALYPFRSDFYAQMGFGYGSKVDEYRISPSGLPKRPSKAHVRYLTADDSQAVLECYAHHAHRTHGMFDKTESELWGMFERPGRRVVGYRDGSRVLAYAVIEFVKLRDDNFVLQDMLVRELIYDTPDALLELLTFFHSLADQVSRIVLPTQDEYLYHLFADPRDGSGHMMPSVAQQTNVSGLGMMYRVIDVAQLFHVLRERDFGGQTCRVKLSVEDTFLPENDGSHVVEFENGRARGAGASDFDVEVRLDVAKFSSLLVGAVTFEALHRLGLAGISDPWYVDTVHRIFATGTKPMCITEF